MTGPLWVVRAGTVPYRRAWAWQRELVARRAAGDIPDTVLLLEHPHVYTLGKRGRDEDVLASPLELELAGAEVVRTDRGGQVTYHGPGQLVGYPITLLPRAPDLLDWIGRVQDALIGMAAAWGVTATADRGDRTGVWVDDAGTPAKLAAIGMRVSRRVTSHGFAFNCDSDLRRFAVIVPCGMPGAAVCSLTSLTGRAVSVADLLPVAERELGRALEREPVPVEVATLDLPADDYDPDAAVAATPAGTR